MTRVAAGLLAYRDGPGGLEVFLVHPGGPFFTRHDDGIWSIPKGIVEEGEELETAARREFSEEVGVVARGGSLLDLGEVKLKSGKIIHVFAFRDNDELSFRMSNEFELEWPKHSGVFERFPEVDRGEWFDLDGARVKLQEGQHPFLDRIAAAAGPASRHDVGVATAGGND